MISLKKFISHFQTASLLGSLPEVELELCSDSRSFVKGQIFWCLVGPNFDGFRYVESVITIGCPCVVYQKNYDNDKRAQELSKSFRDTCFVGLDDTLAGLQQLAILKRNDWYRTGKQIIGITGSNGKTTSKEMMNFLFEAAFPNKVCTTKGNLNNHIGVPLTLLSLVDDQEIAIVEMGTNHPGEIAELASWTRPTSGFITNIGTGHIGFFKTQENILKEKASLMTEILANSDHGFFIVNDHDTFCAQLYNGSTKQLRLSDFDVKIDAQKLRLKIKDEDIEVRNENIFGEHLYLNLSLCLVLCLNLYPDKKELFLQAARQMKLPQNNRAQYHQVAGGPLCFLDAYNANPHSMKASLKSFIDQLELRKITLDKCLFILGDMNELGDLATQYHVEIGSYLKGQDIANIAFVGRYAKDYLRGFGKAHSFAHKSELEQWLKENKQNFDAVFIKGSRSLQLESIIAIF